jgi:hypothetical protein
VHKRISLLLEYGVDCSEQWMESGNQSAHPDMILLQSRLLTVVAVSIYCFTWFTSQEDYTAYINYESFSFHIEYIYNRVIA